MTRKQAEAVVKKIVKQVAEQKKGDGTWDEAVITVEPDVAAKIVENYGLITGCLPLGWRIATRRGHETFVIARTR